MRIRMVLASGLVAVGLFSAAATTIAAAPDTQFFVYEGNTQTEPLVGGTITVCTFHLEAIPSGSDDHETGNWEIVAVGGGVVLSGEYETVGSVGDRIPDVGTMSLADGAYRLRWDSEPIDTSHWSKEFAVVCPGGGTPSPAPTSTASPTGTATATPTSTPTATPVAPPAIAPTGEALPTTGANPAGGAGPIDITLPPTDAAATPARARTTDDTTWMVVLFLGLLSTIVFLGTPATARVRERAR
jgi:hypothetical protein